MTAMTDAERYCTEATSLDGRPLIEVIAITRNGDSIQLRGTASVFEATLFLEIRDASGTEQLRTVQATVGGPERGDWTTTLALSPNSTEIIIGQLESEEGIATAMQRRITIPL